MEGVEEAVRKWMINPKTPKPHPTVLLLGEWVSWEIWKGLLSGRSYAGCCVSHRGQMGRGGLLHEKICKQFSLHCEALNLKNHP